MKDSHALVNEMILLVNKFCLSRRIKSLENDLTPGEMAVISYMYCGEKKYPEVNPSKISDDMMLSRPSITSILNTLEKRGFMKRFFSENDRRKIKISLTEKGRNHAEKYFTLYYAKTQNMINALGEEDTTTFMNFLKLGIEIYSREEE